MGQIVIDKKRCWKELHLCHYYNLNADFYYQHVYGDKETFRMAWHRLGTKYSMPCRDPEPIPYTLAQHDFEGNRLFQHRIQDKWSLAKNQRIKEFKYESECLEFIQELKELWDPAIHMLRNISTTDRSLMRDLAKAQFIYERVGQTRWPVKLSTGGYVYEGSNQRISYWWVDQDQLYLAGSDGNVTCRMRKKNGVWQGKCTLDKKRLLRLKPI